MPVSFPDHFSGRAAEYAKFRPDYPDALFEYLALLPPARRRAWDCATGSGQAALALARYFEDVIATDASEHQIGSATPHARVRYRVATAEGSGLETQSVELVTVAQAVHWFDRERFWREAGRVLVPDGIVAVWCYDLLRVAPEVDEVVNRFYMGTAAASPADSMGLGSAGGPQHLARIIRNRLRYFPKRPVGRRQTFFSLRLAAFRPGDREFIRASRIT